MKIRVKFGKNPYSNRLTCGRCREPFECGGLILRIEHDGKLVDIPICPQCYDAGDLFEGVIDLSHHHACHPILMA